MFTYVEACLKTAFGKYDSTLKAVKAVLTLAASTAQDMHKKGTAQMSPADDFIGWPAMVTWAKYDYGLQDQESFVFEMGSSSDDKNTDTKSLTGRSDPGNLNEKEQDRGDVTKITTGDYNVTAFVRVRRAPALYSSAHYRVTGFRLSANMDATHRSVGGRTLAPETYDGISDIYFTTLGSKPALKKSPTYQVKTAQKPFAPVTIPAPAWVGQSVFDQVGYKPRPASYCEFAFWDEDPGFDPEFVGIFSHTFYHDDFRVRAGKSAAPAVHLVKNKTTGETEVRAEYRYLGLNAGFHRYRGDFTFYEPGGYLDEVSIRAYVSIRED
jgi:hypothetical protein